VRQRLWVIGICILPLIPLFFLNHQFPTDWFNHQWMIAYFGEYFRQHYSFPLVFNTNQVVGMPYPVFYGVFFYPIMGLLSIFISTDLVYRFVVVVLFLAQCFAVKRLFEEISGHKRWALFIAALVTYAIYPLTNLYNRAAATEFISFTLLTCALCWHLCIIFNPEKYLKTHMPYLVALCIILVAGIHPLTGTFGVLLCGFISLLATYQFQNKKPLMKWLAVYGILYLVAMSSWLYIYFKIGIHTEMTRAIQKLQTFPDLESIIARLSPIPLDLRTWNKSHDEILKIIIPYIDTQINTPLLLVCAFLSFILFKSKSNKTLGVHKSVFVFSGVSFSVILLFSVAPILWTYIPSGFSAFQFTYRLVAYCNLLLLVMAIPLSALVIRERLIPENKILKLMLIPVIIAVLGVALKIPRALFVWREYQRVEAPWNKNTDELTELPRQFYGYPAYATTRLYKDYMNNQTEAALLKQYLTVGTGEQFGIVQPVTLTLSESTDIALNVQAFPWSKIYVNEKEYPLNQTMHINENQLIQLNQGEHKIEYRTTPDNIYLCLRWLSLLTIISLLGLIVVKR